MIEFSNEVRIARAPDEVFAFLARFENVPRWNYAIVETRKETPGPVGVGTRYRQIRSLPRRAEESFEVIEHEDGRRLAIRGTIGPFEGDLVYALEPQDGGTRLVNSAELEGRGAARLLGKLGTSRLRDAVARNLEELRRLLEGGT